jgi:hypothetical protein
MLKNTKIKLKLANTDKSTFHKNKNTSHIINHPENQKIINLNHFSSVKHSDFFRNIETKLPIKVDTKAQIIFYKII